MAVLVAGYIVFVTAAASVVHSAIRSPAAQAPPSAAASASRVTVPAPQSLLAAVNKARTRNQQAPVTYSAAAARLAQQHSQAMARQGRVFRDGCLDCFKWRMWWSQIEENVASGTSLQAVYQQFTRGRARARTLCSCVTQAGVGVTRAGGRLWVTEILMRPATGTVLGVRASPQRATFPVITGDPDEDALLHFESQIGRRVGIDHMYVHVGIPLPISRFNWDRAGGRVPLVDWDLQPPVLYSWAQVAAGKADKIINATARTARAYGHPILLSFEHEPEYSVARGHAGPSEFVAAWRHVVDRFRAEGATNVLWVLDYGGDIPLKGTGDLWYPGPSYVDFVGADGYNWYGARHNAQWRSIADVFTSFYFWALSVHKPAMIVETGVLEDPANPGRKAAWFTQADAWLHSHPDIKAFVYFNTPVKWPWWIDTSPQSLAAFRSLAQDPLFSSRNTP
jgi:uncharacterized protein YkwD